MIVILILFRWRYFETLRVVQNVLLTSRTFSSVNGCYKVVTTKQEWSIAGLECRSLHKDAHLLIINDAETQLAVAGMLASADRQCLLLVLLYCFHYSIMSVNVFIQHYIFFVFSCITSELSFQTRTFVFLVGKQQLSKIDSSFSLDTTHSARNLGFVSDEHLTNLWSNLYTVCSAIQARNQGSPSGRTTPRFRR